MRVGGTGCSPLRQHSHSQSTPFPLVAVLAHSGSTASSHRAHSPARTKPPEAAACQAPAGAAFYCYNHKQVLDRTDLKHTCHQKGEPHPPNTWLHESSCTLFKAYLLTRVSSCLLLLLLLLLLFCPYRAPFNKCPAPSCCCWPCSKAGLICGSPAGSLPPQQAGPGVANGLWSLIQRASVSWASCLIQGMCARACWASPQDPGGGRDAAACFHPWLLGTGPSTWLHRS